MPYRTIIAGAAALALGLGASISAIPSPDGGFSGFGLAVSSASAQTPQATDRRVARRTARRTSQRVSYRNTLPAGCVKRNAYWYCGGIYYQAVVQNGTTVYVVVNL